MEQFQVKPVKTKANRENNKKTAHSHRGTTISMNIVIVLFLFLVFIFSNILTVILLKL